jgi:hypothetical protein
MGKVNSINSTNPFLASGSEPQSLKVNLAQSPRLELKVSFTQLAAGVYLECEGTKGRVSIAQHPNYGTGGAKTNWKLFEGTTYFQKESRAGEPINQYSSAVKPGLGPKTFVDFSLLQKGKNDIALTFKLPVLSTQGKSNIEEFEMPRKLLPTLLPISITKEGFLKTGNKTWTPDALKTLVEAEGKTFGTPKNYSYLSSL